MMEGRDIRPPKGAFRMSCMHRDCVSAVEQCDIRRVLACLVEGLGIAVCSPLRCNVTPSNSAQCTICSSMFELNLTSDFHVCAFVTLGCVVHRYLLPAS